MLSRAALDKERRTSHGFESAHGRVNTTRDDAARALVEFFGTRMFGHAIVHLSWAAPNFRAGRNGRHNVAALRAGEEYDSLYYLLPARGLTRLRTERLRRIRAPQTRLAEKRIHRVRTGMRRRSPQPRKWQMS